MCFRTKPILEYLGFIFDSTQMTIFLPNRKREHLGKLLNEVLSSPTQTIEKAAILIGTLIAACPAVPYSLIHTRQLEIEKIAALLESEGKFSAKMVFSNSSIEEIKWWLKVIPNAINPIRSDRFDHILSTDASLTGWGACLDNNSITRGFWSVDERKLHINPLELKGTLNALKSFLSNTNNCQVLIKTDSTTAMSYINKFGGVRSEQNHKIASEIWEWCENRRIWLIATYLNTKQNIVADQASREVVDSNDFELDNISYNKLIKMFGQPEIDLFATSKSKKCPRFYSWFPDPESESVDAFLNEWNCFFYAFPPFSLIGRVLKKIIDDKARGILVVPNWNAQPWYPLFMKMCKNNYIKLEKKKFNLIFPYDGRNHPLKNNLSLLAAIVSGIN
jgi:ribonuclease HI